MNQLFEDQNGLDLVDDDLKPSKIDLYNQAENLPSGATESSESSSKDHKFIAVEDAFGFGDQMYTNDLAPFNDDDQFNEQPVTLYPPWPDVYNDADTMEQYYDESGPGKEGNNVDAQFRLSNRFQKQGNKKHQQHDPYFGRWQVIKSKAV